MPLKKCKKNGEDGWQWGDKGACYVGPGAKKKALKQGFAENKGDQQAFKNELSKAGLLNDPYIEEFLRSVEPQGTDKFVLSFVSHWEERAKQDEWAYAYVSEKERKKMPLEDFAWPEERKFPIKDQKHLDAAVKLIGRAPAGKQAAIKRRIIEIAKRKGLTLPESWGEKSKAEDLSVAYVSVEERKKIPAENFAGKGRKFPINSQAHLDAAVKLVGREPPAAQKAIKQRIKEIAHRLGLKLPASWGAK